MLRKILGFFGLALKKDLDYVYKQRNIAAIMAYDTAQYFNHTIKTHKISVPRSKVTLPFALDFYRDDQNNWDKDWRSVLQITDLETSSQMSWHLDPESAKVAKRLFDYNNKNKPLMPWDGTDFSKTYEFWGFELDGNETT